MRRKFAHFKKSAFVPVRFVPLLEQRRAADAEVSDLEAGTEQLAQHDGITIALAVLDARAVCDAVAHAREADSAPVIGGAQRGLP